jgi:hypothetical protein
MLNQKLKFSGVFEYIYLASETLIKLRDLHTFLFPLTSFFNFCCYTPQFVVFHLQGSQDFSLLTHYRRYFGHCNKGASSR